MNKRLQRISPDSMLLHHIKLCRKSVEPVVPVVVEPDCGKAGSKSTTTTPKTVTAMPHSQQLRYPLRQRKPLTSMEGENRLKWEGV